VCAIIPGHVFFRVCATNAKAQQVGSMWVRIHRSPWGNSKTQSTDEETN